MQTSEWQNVLKTTSEKTPFLGAQSWSPFVTRKSGHIWRIWAEMTQTLMPKSTKAAQIHLPECNSAKFPPEFRQNFRQISGKIRQISQISFHKRALTLNSQPFNIVHANITDRTKILGELISVKIAA